MTTARTRGGGSKGEGVVGDPFWGAPFSALDDEVSFVPTADAPRAALDSPEP